MKKSCVLILNCFGSEVKRNLNRNSSFKKNYDITYVTTYTDKPSESYVDLLQSADLVICQNVKAVHEYSQEYIASLISSDCLLFKIDFWRFNGFWPVKAEGERVCKAFWFPCTEFGSNLTFEDYINHDVGTDLIRENFNFELEKLSKFGVGADIDVYDFFIDNFKSQRLFSDHWHPMPVIFQQMVNVLFAKLGYEKLLEPLAPKGINSNRYRVILNAVREELGLEYEELVHFYGKKITVEEYYYFAKFLEKQDNFMLLKNDDVHLLFNDFMGFNNNLV